MTLALEQATWRTMALVAAVAVGVAACGDDESDPNDDGGGTPTTGITVSAAAPSTGNGTLSNVVVTVDEDAAVAQGAAVFVTITGEVGGVQHQIEAYVLKSDGSFPNIEHKWGADLASPEGFTLCDAGGVVGSVCDAGQATSDLTAGTVTFDGLLLTAATGDGDASTLDGEASW